MSRGINANLLRRWVRDAELGPAVRGAISSASITASAPKPAFVPLTLPDAAAASNDIRVELRRGATTVVVTWPVGAATDCAAWMRELLR